MSDGVVERRGDLGDRCDMAGYSNTNTNDMGSSIMNQAEIMEKLKVEFSRAQRYKCPLSIILVQIDRYDYLTDLYGIDLTQAIFDSISALISGITRLSDFFGKVGQRFLLVLPHTDSAGALITANRIREKLLSLDFDINGKLIKVSLSIGISDNSVEDTIFYDSILKNAESTLKKAVMQGGDRTEIFNSDAERRKEPDDSAPQPDTPPHFPKSGIKD